MTFFSCSDFPRISGNDQHGTKGQAPLITSFLSRTMTSLSERCLEGT